MKKVFAIILLVLALVLVAVFNSPKQFESVDPADIDTDNLISVVSTINLPEPKLALPSINNNTADRAWAVFENYLESAKNHDLTSLRMLSHQISDVCSNPEQEEACFSRMDYVYSLGIQFKREEFKNIWSDDKQIIMASDYTTIDDETFGSRGMARMIIYFTRDGAGNPKILSFNGLDGNFVLKKDLSEEELDKHLLESIRDNDEDGLPNEIDPDPNKRDTNGNGWWDSIETFFY